MASEEKAKEVAEYMWDDDVDDSINKEPCKSKWENFAEVLATFSQPPPEDDESFSAPAKRTRGQFKKRGLPPSVTAAQLKRDAEELAKKLAEKWTRCRHKESHEQLNAMLEESMGESMERMLERGEAHKYPLSSATPTCYIAPPPEAFIPSDTWLEEESNLSPREIRALKNRKDMILKLAREGHRDFVIVVPPPECMYDLIQKPHLIFVSYGLHHLYRTRFPRYTRPDSLAAAAYMNRWHISSHIASKEEE